MPREIQYPFSLNSAGGISFTTTPDVITQQHVESLISTSPGERVMLPDYGIPLGSYVFENGPDAVIASLTNDVESQMSFWEPTLTVQQITPLYEPNNESYGVASINVQYSQNQSSTDVNTAVVLVGGTIIESVTQDTSS